MHIYAVREYLVLYLVRTRALVHLAHMKIESLKHTISSTLPEHTHMHTEIPAESCF